MCHQRGIPYRRAPRTGRVVALRLLRLQALPGPSVGGRTCLYLHGNTSLAMIGNRANMVQVAPIDLLGNAPLGKTRSHFLSDHFGMAVTLRLVTKAIQTITIRSYADISTMTIFITCMRNPDARCQHRTFAPLVQRQPAMT
jgi:hypothetical protein